MDTVLWQDRCRICHRVPIDEMLVCIQCGDIANVGRLILPCPKAKGTSTVDGAATNVVAIQRNVENLSMI